MVMARRVSEEELDRRLAAAEAAVAAARQHFVVWVTEALAKGDAHARRLIEGQGDDQDIRRLFEVAHDLKGVSGSVGYDLMTEVGASLCILLRDAATPLDGRQIKAVEAHWTAARLILEKKVEGDGGELGYRLIQQLARLVEEASSPTGL